MTCSGSVKWCRMSCCSTRKTDTVTGLDLHFRLWRKLWLRSVKPSRATVHWTVAFNGFESARRASKKEDTPNGVSSFLLAYTTQFDTMQRYCAKRCIR